jgi:hypothetical protein
MRVIATLALVCTLGFSSSAAAQPVPDTVRSSSLTRAQETELNNRLARLRDRLETLAEETQLRELAVRNIAIEIFGAQPGLDFVAYTQLIETSARQLQDYITSARQRTDADPRQAALRERAIAAAEDGRLADARAIYQELIEANRNARREARRAEDLADAADIAEAARLAFISADIRNSARLFSDAADTAPVGTRVRWLYRVMQAANTASASSYASGHFTFETPTDPADLAEAIRILRTAKADAPVDWRSLFDQLDSATEPIDTALYIEAAGLGATSELYAPRMREAAPAP